jgi:hypothetical protein
MSVKTELDHNQKCAKAESISDFADIMGMYRYWVDNNKTSHE